MPGPPGDRYVHQGGLDHVEVVQHSCSGVNWREGHTKASEATHQMGHADSTYVHQNNRLTQA